MDLETGLRSGPCSECFSSLIGQCAWLRDKLKVVKPDNRELCSSATTTYADDQEYVLDVFYENFGSASNWTTALEEHDKVRSTFEVDWSRVLSICGLADTEKSRGVVQVRFPPVTVRSMASSLILFRHVNQSRSVESTSVLEIAMLLQCLGKETNAYQRSVLYMILALLGKQSTEGKQEVKPCSLDDISSLSFSVSRDIRECICRAQRGPESSTRKEFLSTMKECDGCYETLAATCISAFFWQFISYSVHHDDFFMTAEQIFIRRFTGESADTKVRNMKYAGCFVGLLARILDMIYIPSPSWNRMRKHVGVLLALFVQRLVHQVSVDTTKRNYVRLQRFWDSLVQFTLVLGESFLDCDDIVLRITKVIHSIENNNQHLYCLPRSWIQLLLRITASRFSLLQPCDLIAQHVCRILTDLKTWREQDLRESIHLIQTWERDVYSMEPLAVARQWEYLLRITRYRLQSVNRLLFEDRSI